jgi:pSer/pThr/pTyr-binding forkhead associated (FHA) protein
MKAKLVERGAEPGQTLEIPINEVEFLIGRGSDCNLRLRATSVSRHHCLIRKENDELILMDLGSSNGTYINGKRILSQTALRSGDELQIGAVRFLVDLGDQPSTDARRVADTLVRTVKLGRQSAVSVEKKSEKDRPE